MPSKILLLPVGSHGDVHPFVGIGQELQRRGHDVTMITNGYFEPLARKAGFNFVELGTAEHFKQAIEDPDIWHPTKGPQRVFEMLSAGLLRPMYQAIDAHVEKGRTILVGGGLAMAARLAHEKLGVPLATLQLQPAVLRSVHEPPVLPGPPIPSWAPAAYIRLYFWLADVLIVDRLVCPSLNAFRRELGLPPVSRVINEWWNSPQRVIGLFPDWYAPPQPDWPPQLRLVGFPLYDEKGVEPLDPDLERFLAAGPPPVVFTPGSAMKHGRWFFEASAEACRLAGRRGLLLSRHPENVPERLPEGVRHSPYVPFSEVLPRSAALVSHGGIGTVAQGLAAGLPQLVMPLSHDQPDNAARLKRLGVGADLLPKRYRAPAVAEKLRELLNDPQVTERAKGLAERIKQERPRERAADLIEALASS